MTAWSAVTGMPWGAMMTWGTPLGGWPFRPDVFPYGRLLMQCAFGADLDADPSTWPWVDTTVDIMIGAKVNIGQGRPDETSQAAPATFTCSLINNGRNVGIGGAAAGDYTEDNPTGNFYPGVGTGVPIRFLSNIGAGPSVEFHGNAVGFTPTWDTTGKLAIVNVVAAGTLRRIGQGKTPLRSPLYRSRNFATPTRWWAMEEGSGSTTAAEVNGGQPLRPLTGSVSFGATGGGGSSASVDFSGGGSLIVSPGPIAPPWRISYAVLPKWTGAQFACPVMWRTADGSLWNIGFSGFGTTTGQLEYRNPNAPGGFGLTEALSFNAFPGLVNIYDGEQHDISVECYQDVSGDLDVVVYVDGRTIGHYPNFLGASMHASPITQIQLNYNSQGANVSTFLVTQLAVWSSLTTPYPAGSTTQAINVGTSAQGWKNEPVDVRLMRVCGEQGIPLTIYGPQPSNILMSYQPIASFASIVTECAVTDGGVLFDGFGPGLGYIMRGLRNNLGAALTADIPSGQVFQTFEPVSDDQRLRNEYTVSRTGGGSYTATQVAGPKGTGLGLTTGVGEYDSSVSVNTADDSYLPLIAWQQVALGTVVGFRYPTMQLDLAAGASALTAPWQAASPPISFRADVTGARAATNDHPPGAVQQIVEGYTMAIDPFTWRVTTTCSPFAPWRAFVIGDPVQGRIESGVSTLHADITAGAVTMQVDAVPIWTTTATFPADFPFDIGIGGEQITVTGIVGTSSPQTWSITRAVNGISKAHHALDVVSLWRPVGFAL